MGGQLKPLTDNFSGEVEMNTTHKRRDITKIKQEMTNSDLVPDTRTQIQKNISSQMLVLPA